MYNPEKERERIGMAYFSFIFPAPPSLLVNAMSVLSMVALTNIGYSEVKGKHLNYSKFWNVHSGGHSQQTTLSGTTGMLLLYTPAFMAALSSFWIFPSHHLRFLLLSSSLALHFFKRIFEVVFIHKYSSRMAVESAIPICLSYLLSTSLMIYSQHLCHGLPEPTIDLKYPGLLLFLLGISGNFYHHLLLSRMRKEGEKEYKIPKGGLFDLVVCPHYLFEIFGFWGFALIAQTIFPCCLAIGTIFYLVGRSYATRRWYLSKFEDFPEHVKALIPHVF